MKRYYEIAIGSPTKRGSLFPIEEIPNIIEQYGNDMPLYRSVYTYPETALSKIGADSSVKNYFGDRGIEYIPIDIDKGKDTDEETIRRTLAICMMLEQKYKIDETNYTIWFSGSGFHIDLSAKLFNIPDSPDLPYIVKTTMTALLGKDIDPSIYSRTGLYRLGYSLNTKTGLHKVKITLKDLMTENINHIKSIATAKPAKLDFIDYEDYMGVDNGNGELASLVCKNVPHIKAFEKILEPINIVTCVQTLYNNGPERGNRNMAIMRIASHFKRSGIPSDATKAALLDWNNRSLDENLVIEHIENVYNRNYKYGCEDPILKKLCNTRCTYYKNKDYSVKLYSASDMQSMAIEREGIGFEGRVIDLAALMGQYEKDCVIYPGELVSIMGPTGSGKTAFVQHLVLGLNLFTGEINPKAQMDTVYLSLELSPQLMHRRNMQIAGNLQKRYVIAHLGEAFKKTEHLISHIKLRVNSGNISDIEELVRTLIPKVLVVDYLDLIESERRSEHEQIKQVAHGLSSIAVRYDMIVILITQVSRDYAREHVLDLYAGKGSGAIENASRKVIGFNGQADSPKKHMSVFKNTDGELLEADVLHNPSTLRFSIDNGESR
jgi:energy-coupling factor transporter ATP-binding protein EcfA2